jgi:ribosomal-protein-alanine N-acetyltransferase
MKEEAQLIDLRARAARTVRIRVATIRDLGPIMDIESLSFTTPWSSEAMTQEIERRDWSRVAVAMVDDYVVGFMVYWIVVNELHLLNLAVRPDWRRRGIGTAMVCYLVELADDNYLSTLFLEVRMSNKPAQKLYRQFGFKPVAIRQNYYSDNGEDAIVMCLRRSE